MNKLMLLNILIEVVKKYIESKDVSVTTFCEIVNTISYEEYDANKVAYKESILLFYIFSNIPYYRITYTLEDIRKKITKSCDGHDKYNELAKIIVDGYLVEIMPSITRRIETEASMHILELIQTYYLYGNLDNKTLPNRYDNFEVKSTIDRLTVNICDPKILTGLDVAEVLFYPQLTIFKPNEADNDLRDNISKSNFSYTQHVKNALKNSILKYYNSETFENFVCEVEEKIKRSDIKDKDLILEVISSVIEKSYISVSKKWEKKLEINGHQLTLKGF